MKQTRKMQSPVFGVPIGYVDIRGNLRDLILLASIGAAFQRAGEATATRTGDYADMRDQLGHRIVLTSPAFRMVVISDSGLQF
jgi:hypothetical protein